MEGQARRPGQRPRRRRHVEGPHRQRQPARGEPHQPGARDRGGRHRRHEGRPDPVDSGRSARRGRRAERQHQHDDRQPARDDRSQPGAGLAEDEPREVHAHAAGPARSRHRRQAAAVRAGAARQRAAGRDLPDGERLSDTSPALSLLAGYAIGDDQATRIEVGKGLVGQCALEKQRILLTKVPRELHARPVEPRQRAPKNIVVLPVLFEGETKAVIELSSLEPFTATRT